MRIFIILIVFAMLVGCNTRNPKLSQVTKADFDLPEFRAALRLHHDTTITLPDGRAIGLHFNDEYVSVNTELNGPVTYVYGTFQGEYTYDSAGDVTKHIFKAQLDNDSLSVFLGDDSIRINEKFKASIWVRSPHYKIVITSPYQDTIASETLEPDQQILIARRLAVPGIYNFDGAIIYSDGRAIPFNYRFIVEDD
jgi:hypothetical protein